MKRYQSHIVRAERLTMLICQQIIIGRLLHIRITAPRDIWIVNVKCKCTTHLLSTPQPSHKGTACSWVDFISVAYARRCAWPNTVFRLQPSVNLHAQLQPLCSIYSAWDILDIWFKIVDFYISVWDYQTSFKVNNYCFCLTLLTFDIFLKFQHCWCRNMQLQTFVPSCTYRRYI